MTEDPLDTIRDRLLTGVAKESVRRRRRRASVALGAVVLALGVAGLAKLSPWDHSVDDAVVAGQGDAAPEDSDGPSWEDRRAEELERLDELDEETAAAHRYGPLWERLGDFPPIDAGDGAPAVVWVRSQLFIWGGAEHHASIHFPLNGPAAPIPDAPIPVRRDPAAVAFEDSVFIWGGSDGNGPRSDGAIYDLGDEQWTEVPPAPLPAGVPLATVGTGDEILVFGQRDQRGDDQDLVRGAAFDPSNGVWRSLPDAPAAVNSGNGVWTGSELVILGSRLNESNAGAGPIAMAYSPKANEWRMVPSPDLVPQSTWLTADNGRLYAWDYLLEAAVLDLGGSQEEWRSLPPIPLREKECYVSGGVSNSRILMTYCGEGALLEQDESGWMAIPAPPGLGPFTTPIGAVVVTDDGAWRLREP